MAELMCLLVIFIAFLLHLFNFIAKLTLTFEVNDSYKTSNYSNMFKWSYRNYMYLKIIKPVSSRRKVTVLGGHVCQPP